MNFLLKSLVLLFLGSSILFACKNESKVGLDVLPQGQQIGTFMEDTFSVELTTILPDSVNTTNPYNIWVGDINDTKFGKISATTYTQVGILSENYVFPTDAVYDSLTFTFKYTNIKYGDSTNDFTLNIHQLKDEIYKDSTYYNNSKIEYNSTAIGSKTFSLKHNENEKMSLFDSVSIKLDDVLGANLVSKFNEDELKTQTAFNSYFKGIALVSGNNNTSLIAGSIKDTTINGIAYERTSKLVLHCHSASSSSKSLKYKFPIDNGSSRKFTNFKSDRAGTLISSLTKPNDTISAKTSTIAYLQAGSGLCVKLAFPSIKKLKQDLGAVVINKAELIIPSVDSKNKYTNTAPSLYMFQAKANGTLALSAASSSLPIQTDESGITGNSSVQFIKFDYNTNQYKVVMTDYIQALMYDKVSEYYLLKSAFPGANNLIIGNSKHTTAPIKLRVHYSKIE